MQGDPDIIAAQDAIRKSRATVGASRSDYFPQLTPNAGFQGSNSANNANFNPNAPLDIDTGPRKQFTVGVTLEQNIF